ncbi:dihydropteroate synthase [Yoonia sp. MH D7]
MTIYYRPLLQMSGPIPSGAYILGWCWFDQVEVLQRNLPAKIVAANSIPQDVLAKLTTPRVPIAGISLNAPRLMGILNVTPDSFSDGGHFSDISAATTHAAAMIASGADILDIGGESTRPGAQTVDNAVEIARTAPVIRALRAVTDTPISIDTRKADVAQAALAAGASLINDVSAMTHDPAMAQVAINARAPVCLMHANGTPQTMQIDPIYDNVLLDVYDALATRIQIAIDAGIARENIIVDPGIGFGKTQTHNLTLLRGLSLFHSLGCAVLLGASRKKFIGTIGQAATASDRTAGSVAVALHGVAQGVQILRVHDIYETKQAIRLQLAIAEQQ